MQNPGASGNTESLELRPGKSNNTARIPVLSAFEAFKTVSFLTEKPSTYGTLRSEKTGPF